MRFRIEFKTRGRGWNKQIKKNLKFERGRNCNGFFIFFIYNQYSYV